jgi:membrane fusion protein (multidrug efflux system)
MFARVRLITNAVQQGITIPEQAVVLSGDEFYVFRVVDGRAARTRVEIGTRREGSVEVVRGLSQDDVIVTAGQLKIRDGAPVQIMAAPADKAPQTGSAAAPARSGEAAKPAPASAATPGPAAKS